MARSINFILDFFMCTALNSLGDCWNEQKLPSKLDPRLIFPFYFVKFPSNWLLEVSRESWRVKKNLEFGLTTTKKNGKCLATGPFATNKISRGRGEENMADWNQLVKTLALEDAALGVVDGWRICCRVLWLLNFFLQTEDRSNSKTGAG